MATIIRRNKIQILTRNINLPVYNLTSSVLSIDEGLALMFTFTTNQPDGTYYWTNSGTTTGADFTDGLNDGSFVITAGTGSVVKTLTNDQITEGSETAIFEIRSGSLSGSIVASRSIDINDTSVTQYAVDSSLATVNEGSSITFTFTTTGPDGVFYWTTSGTVSASDFSDGLTSGTVTVNGGVGSVSRTLSADVATEGGETIIFEVRANSESGPILATKSVDVNDTSITTYLLTRTSPAGSDIQSESLSTPIVFTFTTTGPNETFYWTNGGTANASDFTDGVNSGSFVTTNGTGSISRVLYWDSAQEGIETFIPQVRIGSYTGTIVASSSVRISNNDWHPGQLSPLMARYESTAGVTTDASDLVTQWSDQSGNGYHLLSNVGFRPKYLWSSAPNGRAGIAFGYNNARTFIQVTNANYNMSNVNDMTIVWIGKVNNPLTSRGMVRVDNNANVSYTRSIAINASSNALAPLGVAANQNSSVAGVSAYSTIGADNGSYNAVRIATRTSTSINYYVYSNAGTLKFATATDLNLASFDNSQVKRIFIGTDISSLSWSDMIAYEVIIYNKELSLTEMNRIGEYAKNRYGISLTL